ncbi:T9SS type A sorting domain-containing protein [Myroides sp. DF42-4-2]|uniref:T9SS type A sorting domain-containing protein n=1 Tax=Myroides sp. DF42-4-2 TaxID=2746726 RepID=UPI0025768D35|nr:T9SS type A sorting domain-containing protein [Myroides sp. DF42-4-2]MDM1408512.1 T9SS type A sorting domain-containing protein [Myroides sp. DF42-4-2]
MFSVPIKLDATERGASALELPALSLLPNPTTTVTTVVYKIGSSNDNAQYLVVYDLLGVERYRQKINVKKTEIVLEVSHLAKGTYLISLEADGKRIATEKLIKK